MSIHIRCCGTLFAQLPSRSILGYQLLIVPGTRHVWPAHQPAAFDDASRLILAKG